MKQYRKPTRTQKEVLTAHGFEVGEWRFVADDKGIFEYINPSTGEHIFLNSEKRR